MAQGRGKWNKCVVFDADDTLWEDNVLYSTITQDVAEYLWRESNGRIAPDRVLQVLDEVEHELIPIHGYGPPGFRTSVIEACRRLCVSIRLTRPCQIL